MQLRAFVPLWQAGLGNTNAYYPTYERFGINGGHIAVA